LGVEQGRDGKGIVFVFASGNNAPEGANVNFDAVLDNRFTISVGAIHQRGNIAFYSAGGAALLVVAPAGDGVDGNDNEMVGAEISNDTT